MKLVAKFSLVFVIVFGIGFAAAAYLAQGFLRKNATDEVIQNAQLMMQTALSMRNYTTQQIKPLLSGDKFHDSFYPQTVPAYAATESFNYLRAKYPEYSYKEATLNPTNPRDRPADWEADVIRIFRDHPERKSLVGSRDTIAGTSWYLAQPIAAGPPCLECHSTAAAAPAAMVAIYGNTNGFGWKPNEVVGAQIVSVPASLPNQIASSAFRNLLTDMSLVALITLIAVDLALILIVVRPVSKLSEMADRISKGELDVPELPVQGKDEIAVLAGSFDRMRISMAKAIKLLEGE
jgi:HAMP domain-containing protein/type II secretory pathway pseudopilin PulG